MELLEYTNRWDPRRLGSLFQEQKEKNTQFTRKNALKFTYGSIVDKPEYDMTPSLVDTYSKYTLVDEGDIVINCLNLNYDFVSQRVAIVKNDGIITSAYISLRARSSDINPMYYCYYFKAMDARKMFHGMGTGIRLTLSYNELRNVPIPVPPRAEQDQIVRFLDWKVSEINKLIGIRRKEIQELKALKSAVITAAITKGIDPNAAMKKTDVYYLPEVPSAWEVTKLKRICKVGASINEQLKKHDDQDEVVFLPMENISEDGEIDCSIKQPIAKVKTGFSSFAKDDVIVAKITPCFENGKGACLDKLESDIGYGTTELFNLRAGDDVLPEYLYFITMTKLFRILGEGQMTGSAGQKRVPADYIRDFTIGLPALDEQQVIVEYIHNEKERIDRLIATKHEQLSALTEFKSTIISDTVTGKIDVRNVSVPEYEHVDDIADDDSDGDEEPDETETEMDEEV
jgi:type I restriction enzyme S subunit